jgi:hypothetical protein
MPLIMILGCLLTVGIASSDRLTSKDKVMMVIVLGTILGIISLFA